MSRTTDVAGSVRAGVGAGISAEEPASIQEELAAITKGTEELLNRLTGMGDVIVGPMPSPTADEGRVPQPGTLRASITRIGELIKECHGELSRTTRHLDL